MCRPKQSVADLDRSIFTLKSRRECLYQDGGAFLFTFQDPKKSLWPSLLSGEINATRKINAGVGSIELFFMMPSIVSLLIASLSLRSAGPSVSKK